MKGVVGAIWIAFLQLLALTAAVSAEVKTKDSSGIITVNISTNSVQESEKSGGQNFTLSTELMDKGYNFLKRSPVFKDYTKEEIHAILQELETWEAPEYYQRKFPYYHAGFDYDDRPFWISELGKYNMRAVVEKGQDALADFDKYVLQAAFNVLKSIHERNEAGKEVNEVVFLVDYDGLDMYQLTHIPTVTFALRIARIYSDLLQVALGRCIIINANYVGELAVNLLRPILGGILERVEVYGTNKAKWLPVLKKAFPENALPIWYGGSENFKPVKIFG